MPKRPTRDADEAPPPDGAKFSGKRLAKERLRLAREQAAATSKDTNASSSEAPQPKRLQAAAPAAAAAAAAAETVLPPLPVLSPGLSKPPSKHVSHRRWAKLEAAWAVKFEKSKLFKTNKNRFPKVNRKKDRESLEEQSLYDFLYRYVLTSTNVRSHALTLSLALRASLYRSLPSENGHTPERWAKLNEAFGEGWEYECFPYLGTGGLLEEGHQRNPRDEVKWDATLAVLTQFEKDNGRFPKDTGGEEERRLYYWLYNTADMSGTMYTKERAAKLDAAFGDRWQSRAFPKSFYYW